MSKKAKTVIYPGTKNLEKHMDFIEICTPSQKELKGILEGKLRENGYEPINGDGYLYAKGSYPVLLTAHMDTVHEHCVKDWYISEQKGETVISSPQGIGGDDRCGVYMILKLIEKYHCSILFCEDEEVGSVGCKKFVCSKDVDNITSENTKFILELDRAHGNDAVFYDCDNPEFTKFVTETTGYKKKTGSWSDVCTLMDYTRIAGVNLSCGYYNPHTLQEYVVYEEMMETVKASEKLLAEVDTEGKCWEFIEEKWYDDCDENYGWYYGNAYAIRVYIEYDNGKDAVHAVVNGYSVEECFGKFFMDNPGICYNDILDWYVS